MPIQQTSGPRGPGGGGGSNPYSIIIEMMRIFFGKIEQFITRPVKVYLPENIYNPDGSETFDIMRLQLTNANTKETVLEYTAGNQQTIRFTRYGIFNNKTFGAEVRFYPTINGKRILVFHGDPLDNFSLYLSVGVDLSENAMIPCDITLNPGDTLKWEAENISGVNGEFAVRMRGYIVNTHKKVKSGG